MREVSVQIKRLALIVFALNVFTCWVVSGQAFTVGNTNASDKNYSEGEVLIEKIKPLFSIEKLALSPQEIKERLGIELIYIGSNEWTNGKVVARARNYIADPSFSHTVEYSMGWGRQGQNATIHLTIKIDENKACIFEEMLRKRLGSKAKFGRSTLRHFGRGQTPPAGLRPTRDTWTYSPSNWVSISFSYDYVCASEIEVMNLLPDWNPPKDPIASMNEFISTKTSLNEALEILSGRGFVCDSKPVIKCESNKEIEKGTNRHQRVLIQGSGAENTIGDVSIMLIPN